MGVIDEGLLLESAWSVEDLSPTSLPRIGSAPIEILRSVHIEPQELRCPTYQTWLHATPYSISPLLGNQCVYALLTRFDKPSVIP